MPFIVLLHPKMWECCFCQETKKNDVVSEGLSCKASHEERQKIVNFAKSGVRNRRGRKMQVDGRILFNSIFIISLATFEFQGFKTLLSWNRAR